MTIKLMSQATKDQIADLERQKDNVGRRVRN